MAYEPTVWKTGDIVSSEKLNKLENGLAAEESRSKSEEARLEQLFTTPTQEAVNSYLDAHPEATTTVQDGAITYEKLSTGLKGKCDDVDDLKADLSDVEASLGKTEASSNLLNPNAFVEGYYSSGVWTESSSYLTSDYIDVSNSENTYIHMFNLNNDTTQDNVRYFQYIYWFDENKAYTTRTSVTVGTTVYTIPSSAVYCRIMGSASQISSYLADNKGFYAGIVDASNWIAFDAGGVPNYPDIIENINNRLDSISFMMPAVSLENNIYTITTNKALYKFQKVTIANENLDTWRLYDGYLRNGESQFNMWHNSDAEGAIKIAGETDYVSGFHGSEIVTSFHVFKDGVDVTDETSIEETSFNTLMFYVESDVYHCYQDSAVADTVAFKRAKVIEFAGNRVRISNSYVAQGDFTVTSARIALFQCYKTDGNTPVFTDFSVNSDFKNYAVADVATTIPTASVDMNEAILNTIYGNIHFKSILTSGQAYKGAVVNFASQNRIKFYFDTISYNKSITQGEQILSQFEFEII